MRVGVCVLVSIIAVGCGARSARPVEWPRVDAPSPDATPEESAAHKAASASLSEFMATVRARMAEARPPERPAVAHVEARDPRLATAILTAKIAPSPQTFRRVAEEYERLSINDRAHDYLHDAKVMDSRDAATYVAMARLWRNGGLLNLALADAHRAIYYAPASAAAHNVLGTVLQALGQREPARREYERALQIDPQAAYALNNLCYGWILDREPGKAVAACQAALTIDPALAAARNNLGLAHAARGEYEATRGAFARVGDDATALYNLGIVYMGRRQYPDAVSAFVAAQQARPSFHQASVRAEQAGRLARAGAD